MKTMRLDDRVESYRSFMDYAWVQEIDKLTSGTVLEGLVFALIVSWKATANAHAMPFLMMHMLKGLEEGYLRPKPGLWEHAVRTLSDGLPTRMGKEHGLSHMKQKQLSEMIKKTLDGAEAIKPAMEPLDPQQLFHTFLFGPGGTELQLGVFGLYSPDGKALASASWDETLKLWDVATGKNTATLQGHTSSFQSVV